MIYIRKSNERGNTRIDWLNSYHTFSFGNYYDPGFMGFASLRVINDDIIQPGFGFGRHPHDNMEIITYVVEGALEHNDSMGTGSVIKPGEIQIMSAGTGIEHSEFNHSKTDKLHLLQIWIIPDKSNLTPSYQQEKIKKVNNQFVLIGSKEKAEGVVLINQNVKLYAAYLTKNHELDYPLENGRVGWLQLIKGKLKLNNHEISAGDGVAIQGEKIHLTCLEDAELLFFNLSEH